MPANSALVLGIDVGTGSAKAVVADVEGDVFVSESQTYAYGVPEAGAAEQDPEDWWQAVCHVVRRLSERVPRFHERLRGVAVSGQGAASVLLDAHGQPLRPAMLWMDTRCSAEAQGLSEKHGSMITAISGKQPAAYNVEPKLLWVKRAEPDIWKQVAKVVTTTGYVNFRLTGRTVLNRSDAGIQLSYDLRSGCWSDEALLAMDLPREIFCELVDSDSLIGTVTEEASRDSGLRAGLPLFGGGEDTSSAGLAMGVTGRGDVQLSMGTACTVYIPFDVPVFDPRLLAFPHVSRGMTLVGGSMVSGGISIEWLLKLLGHGAVAREPQSTELMTLTEEAETIPCGCDGLIFLPYLAGELQPVNDGYARGVFFGLSLSTSAGHLLRAVMEGTAYAIRHNLDVARECGAAPERMCAVGGPSKNNLWCQIIADVNGLPLKAMQDNAGAAFGDAILAALGSGLIDGCRAMQSKHARTRREFIPEPGNETRYRQGYAIFRELYPRLKDLFPRGASGDL